MAQSKNVWLMVRNRSKQSTEWDDVARMPDVQCRHLIPALNMWAAQAECTTVSLIATQSLWLWCMYDLTVERRFNSQATWAIEVLGLFFWRVIYVCLYNNALPDVRSTGAGIKCLYCTCREDNQVSMSLILLTKRKHTKNRQKGTNIAEIKYELSVQLQYETIFC